MPPQAADGAATAFAGACETGVAPLTSMHSRVTAAPKLRAERSGVLPAFELPGMHR
jgi:hypothetical protein